MSLEIGSFNSDPEVGDTQPTPSKVTQSKRLMNAVALVAASGLLPGSTEVEPETTIESGPGRKLNDDEAAYVAGTLGPAIVATTVERPTK